MAPWNPDGFKVGLCSTPPVGLNHALLSLSNSSAIQDTFRRMRTKFDSLFRHKAYLSHFREYTGDDDIFIDARETMRELEDNYGASTFSERVRKRRGGEGSTNCPAISTDSLGLSIRLRRSGKPRRGTGGC